MPYGNVLKRHYWAIVDRELNVLSIGLGVDGEKRCLWDDYGEIVQLFYKSKLSEKEYKIIKWTPMIKPENWK